MPAGNIILDFLESLDSIRMSAISHIKPHLLNNTRIGLDIYKHTAEEKQPPFLLKEIRFNHPTLKKINQYKTEITMPSDEFNEIKQKQILQRSHSSIGMDLSALYFQHQKSKIEIKNNIEQKSDLEAPNPVNKIIRVEKPQDKQYRPLFSNRVSPSYLNKKQLYPNIFDFNS